MCELNRDFGVTRCRTFSYQGVYLVSVLQHFSYSYYIVTVFVVPPIIVQLLLLVMRGVDGLDGIDGIDGIAVVDYVIRCRCRCRLDCVGGCDESGSVKRVRVRWCGRHR